MAERIGVYPGTFDPITLGHLDIIRRGAHLVDRLVIGVTTNPSKEPMFTHRRAAGDGAARGGAAWQANIAVVEFNSLLMDFAESQGASMIIRGLRAVADFEYEFQMAGMNQQLNDDIETVFLMADVSLQPIASRLVKEIARYGGCDRQVRHAGSRGGCEAAPRRRSGRMIGRVLFSLVGRLRLVAAQPAAGSPQPAPAMLGIIAPQDVANDPSNRLTLELSTGGKVVIMLRPDAAPAHVERIKTLVRQRLLQRPDLPSRGPRLHGPGRRSEGHGRGRIDASRPQGRVQHAAVPSRHRRRGARGQPGYAPTASSSSCSRRTRASNNKYTVMGRVIEGMDAVDAIAPGEPPAAADQDRPRLARRLEARACASTFSTSTFPPSGSR